MKEPRACGEGAATTAGVDRQLELESIRGRILVEESRELVVVLDDNDVVLAASKRARESLDRLREGERISPELLVGSNGTAPVTIAYEAGGQRERLVYLAARGDLSAYEELRSGFTASVSHELRTPLARLLALLETALLPGEDPLPLVEQARSEVEQIRELIDDVLFLSELETGRAVVSLNRARVLPLLEQAASELERIRDARGHRAAGRGRRLGGDRPASAHAAHDRLQPGRERHPLCRRRSDVHALRAARGRPCRAVGD